MYTKLRHWHATGLCVKHQWIWVCLFFYSWIIWVTQWIVAVPPLPFKKRKTLVIVRVHSWPCALSFTFWCPGNCCWTGYVRPDHPGTVGVDPGSSGGLQEERVAWPFKSLLGVFSVCVQWQLGTITFILTAETLMEQVLPRLPLWQFHSTP